MSCKSVFSLLVFISFSHNVSCSIFDAMRHGVLRHETFCEGKTEVNIDAIVKNEKAKCMLVARAIVEYNDEYNISDSLEPFVKTTRVMKMSSNMPMRDTLKEHYYYISLKHPLALNRNIKVYISK